ncbi:hypothetical protein HanRHA438_Chr03g0135501 [Helianthus annuus]|nr:hypothetical protein HanRHA438_Chr03g0135501 [Helianthus annuus]
MDDRMGDLIGCLSDFQEVTKCKIIMFCGLYKLRQILQADSFHSRNPIYFHVKIPIPRITFICKKECKFVN